ncbi:hypothetical protein D3C80_869560 [compost metagenome]
MAALRVVQAQACIEGHAGAAGCAQLLAGALEGVRLAENLPVEGGDLVGADDQVLGVAAGEGAAFLFGQAADQSFGAFSRQRVFVDLRRLASERQVQALEQGATVG